MTRDLQQHIFSHPPLLTQPSVAPVQLQSVCCGPYACSWNVPVRKCWSDCCLDFVNVNVDVVVVVFVVAFECESTTTTTSFCGGKLHS